MGNLLCKIIVTLCIEVRVILTHHDKICFAITTKFPLPVCSRVRLCEYSVYSMQVYQCACSKILLLAIKEKNLLRTCFKSHGIFVITDQKWWYYFSTPKSLKRKHINIITHLDGFAASLSVECRLSRQDDCFFEYVVRIWVWLFVSRECSCLTWF